MTDSQSDMRVVGVATTGVYALRLGLDSTPDIVVMDQAMPEMNGTEAAQAIRERRPKTRIIMLSMHSNIEHVQRALRAGAVGYVLKASAGEEVAARDPLRTCRAPLPCSHLYLAFRRRGW